MPDEGYTAIGKALEAIPPISLGEMDSIKLMNRIDTKYLTDEATLALVLRDAAAAGYRALETEGSKISPYFSVYFDTPALNMFLDHHNRRLNRQKVRTREYLDSGLSFLEIKLKNNKGRTRKKRIRITPDEMTDFSADREAVSYLNSHSSFSLEEISPEVSTGFGRITLVNPEKTERLTIDTRLEFSNFRSGHGASLENAVIIELKQDGRASSRMKGILLDHRVKPLKLSKYCIAVTLTEPSVKSGRFKTKVRAIEKMINKKS